MRRVTSCSPRRRWSGCAAAVRSTGRIVDRRMPVDETDVRMAKNILDQLNENPPRKCG